MCVITTKEIGQDVLQTPSHGRFSDGFRGTITVVLTTLTIERVPPKYHPSGGV